MSLRSSERGLKFHLVGVMINPLDVAPFVGAWIEIRGELGDNSGKMSLRSSERGLKYK